MKMNQTNKKQKEIWADLVHTSSLDELKENIKAHPEVFDTPEMFFTILEESHKRHLVIRDDHLEPFLLPIWLWNNTDGLLKENLLRNKDLDLFCWALKLDLFDFAKLIYQQYPEESINSLRRFDDFDDFDEDSEDDNVFYLNEEGYEVSTAWGEITENNGNVEVARWLWDLFDEFDQEKLLEEPILFTDGAFHNYHQELFAWEIAWLNQESFSRIMDTYASFFCMGTEIGINIDAGKSIMLGKRTPDEIKWALDQFNPQQLSTAIKSFLRAVKDPATVPHMLVIELWHRVNPQGKTFFEKKFPNAFSHLKNHNSGQFGVFSMSENIESPATVQPLFTRVTFHRHN